MRADLGAQGALMAVGLVWSVGVVLWKLIAASGLSPLGLTVWQTLFAVGFLWALVRLRGRRLHWDREHLTYYAGLGLLGSLVPTTCYYIAMRGLDAGVAAIVISCVPMLALLAATLLRIDRPSLIRILGVVLGFAAMALIAAPGSLPDAGALPYLGFALIAALCYGLEGAWIVLRSPDGLDPVSALLGASVVTLALGLPLALATGHLFPPALIWNGTGLVMLAATAANIAAYLGYIWIVDRAGPVFAAQVSYIITLGGVFWSVTLLDESYTGQVWLSLVLMLAGLALVQPRRGKLAA